MNPRIVIVGEAWGSNEAAAGASFVGASGALLNQLCTAAGLLSREAGEAANKAVWGRAPRRRDAIYAEAGIRLTNVFNFQPPGNKIEALCGPRHDSRPPIRPGKYLRAEFYHELGRLDTELAAWNPNIIIGLGATALWYATGIGTITKHRGTVTDTPRGKFLATFHPAYLLRGAKHLQPVVISDLQKAHRHSHTATVDRPARTIHIPETLDDIASALPLLTSAETIAIDIETAISQITCIGFAWAKDQVLVIPIWDTRKADRSYWGHNEEPLVWEYIRTICALPNPKVFQNGLYDMHYLWRSYGIPVANAKHDTMLLHHALQPEVQKGLGFLGSLYTDEPAWKQMRQSKTTLKREDE